MSLTPQQKEAVAHQGNLLLTACPGSGKTRTLSNEAPVEARVRLQLETLPLAPHQLYLPPRRRREPAEREVEVRPPDPALALYLRAVDLFQLRVSVSPDRLAAYVEGALGERTELSGAISPSPISTIFWRSSAYMRRASRHSMTATTMRRERESSRMIGSNGATS